MSKKDTGALLKFLKPFGEELTDRVMWLREIVWDLYPNTNELIYDNYNALAFGWSITDKLGHTFCSIAVGRTSKNVHFGFYRGNELKDPEEKLLGQGNQYRYILVENKAGFPEVYIRKLLKEAYANAKVKAAKESHSVEGKTIVKSISPVKRKRKN